MLKQKSTTVTIGDTEYTFETGRVARQAQGAVTMRTGDTIVFASACFQPEKDKSNDFLPLRVDYQEKFSAGGKTLGGFIKREGRPSERETLICRLIDRPLRPMFEKGYFCETQVVTYVWSYDGEQQTDAMAICAAGAALYISDIPFPTPVAGVRVGRIDGKFVINPSPAQMDETDLDLIMAGTEDAVLMIEGFCDFLNDDEVIEAIYLGHAEIKKICACIKAWGKEIGKEKNKECLHLIPEELHKTIEEAAGSILEPAMTQFDKDVRQKGRDDAWDAVQAKLSADGSESKFQEADIKMAFKKLQAKYLRTMAIEKEVRCDGRKLDQVRQIDVQPGFLPRTHGSTLFTRGETQAVATCTLGGSGMAQRYETLAEAGSRAFYLQYTFPPFCVGEVGRMGPPGRREVGHGKLAERALFAIIPTEEAFPYTIRIESNITESNGSSSMASVCGGCLAMMDAGVPIKRPVAGIAMGLVLEGDKHVILSDILGLEDFLGDMDFKITGDDKGITAFQMDIKVEGITAEIMHKALKQARDGRVHILQKMLEALPEARPSLSDHAPRIEVIKIHPSKIGIVVGPGGKQIRAIIEETGVEINIEDDGTVKISSPNRESIERAKSIVEGLTAEVEIGRTYHGKIAAIVAFGCFVEVLPGKEGLCHISEFANERVGDMNDVAKVGDMIDVKVIDINERGQMKLSRKATLAKV